MRAADGRCCNLPLSRLNQLPVEFIEIDVIFPLQVLNLFKKIMKKTTAKIVAALAFVINTKQISFLISEISSTAMPES